ncbi:hypothetical protein ACIBL3_06625 [Kribbella sp. NPDC050124]|uniref:hypothetical protein n=1 Tax=Kribbella sp. NPDC050124 TaxID=3364114 RepID=UPI0037B0BEDD
MAENPDVRAELRAQIETRRAGIAAFLREVRPRRNRLTNISIVSSALAAAFVAGPALMGVTFTKRVQGGLSLDNPADVWQPLCLAALIVSLISVISSNLSKSQDLSARVTAAEVCNTELEGVLTSLQFGHLSVEDAVEQYQESVSKIPFVEESLRK